MPLHDWTNPRGWGGVHSLWMTDLLRWIKPRLPAGYRAFLGNTPVVTIDSPPGQPDVAIGAWTDEPPGPEAEAAGAEPDVEVATAKLDPQISLFVELEGRLIAALELVSPRNKDRPAARDHYSARYVGYLVGGVHLMIVDVHPRPRGFSFADAITAELELPDQPRLPAPYAISYRVGGPAATGGRMVGIWRRPLTVGQTLPLLQLPITMEAAVTVDLEQTYMRAAADAYLT